MWIPHTSLANRETRHVCLAVCLCAQLRHVNAESENWDCITRHDFTVKHCKTSPKKSFCMSFIRLIFGSSIDQVQRKYGAKLIATVASEGQQRGFQHLWGCQRGYSPCSSESEGVSWIRRSSEQSVPSFQHSERDLLNPLHHFLPRQGSGWMAHHHQDDQAPSCTVRGRLDLDFLGSRQTDQASAGSANSADVFPPSCGISALWHMPPPESRAGGSSRKRSRFDKLEEFCHLIGDDCLGLFIIFGVPGKPKDIRGVVLDSVKSETVRDQLPGRKAVAQFVLFVFFY